MHEIMGVREFISERCGLLPCQLSSGPGGGGGAHWILHEQSGKKFPQQQYI